MRSGLLDSYAASAEMRSARAVLERGGARLGGFWGGSFGLFAAAWRDDRAGVAPSPCLVVTASQDEADEIAEEIQAFAPLGVWSFPPWESLFSRDELPDPDVCRERLGVLDALARGAADLRFIVASIEALLGPVPAPAVLGASRLVLGLREKFAPGELALLCLKRGYRSVSLVEKPGEFSLRGDVFDIYPYTDELALRLELFDDAVDSIRRFDPRSQRSVEGGSLERVAVLLAPMEDLHRDVFRGGEPLLFDYLPAVTAVIVKEPAAVRERAERILGSRAGEHAVEALAGFTSRLDALRPVEASATPLEPGADGVTLGFRSVERFAAAGPAEVFARLDTHRRSGSRLLLYCESSAEERRVREIAADHKLELGGPAEVVVGTLRRGFDVVELGVVVLTTRELFNRRLVRRTRRRTTGGRAIQGFFELARGDFVVHLVHGIGRYLGVERYKKDGAEQEFLAIEFRDGVKVYVPVANIDLVQKYVGCGDAHPVLDRIGGKAWARKKESVEQAVMDLASELIELQALRSERPGVAYPPDSEWQREFEALFPFDDTPDQVEVTRSIKEDMGAPRPMDRLICGDVGFGKTELAMRAAFKTVDAGKQVVVLVPTTILAEQHVRSFRERMAEFPVRIDVLSRFRSRAEQRDIVGRAASGGVDILIGTHRLLSSDVTFRDLGLVVIDEEQRFGVTHKEALKKLRSQVDVLTLSATPIPRTLHMALLGIRDISSLTTPPEGRSPIHTEIAHFDERLIREAILRELHRDGQVYFLHNRVHDIEVVEARLASIVPEARIDHVHGQMHEHELEEKMMRFLERQTDVLVATTLIENGIDIPSVNTIVIHESDRYGLADLHQLRGRVGRSKHQAYCFLLLPEGKSVSEEAHKRLQALVEFSGLGSGFQIAMRDLEIRGAGNILGQAQSGHIAAVGYDLYCRLLEKCVAHLRNAEYREPLRVEIDLAVRAFLPDGFVRGESEKLELYRRVAGASRPEEVDEVRAEFSDRFGALPQPVLRLFEVQMLRILCAERGVEYVGREGQALILKGRDAMRALLDGVKSRVAVLDARTVAVSLEDPSRTLRTNLDEERLFDLVSEWLRTGTLTLSSIPRRRFESLSPPRGRAASAAKERL